MSELQKLKLELVELCGLPS